MRARDKLVIMAQLKIIAQAVEVVGQFDCDCEDYHACEWHDLALKIATTQDKMRQRDTEASTGQLHGSVVGTREGKRHGPPLSCVNSHEELQCEAELKCEGER